MEQEKNNKGVITLLVVLVVILAILCVLFATGTISFSNNSANSSQQTSENNQQNTNDNNAVSNGAEQNQNIEENNEIIYYQWYPEEDESRGGTHSSDTLELHSDGTAKLYGGKRNSSGWSYEGTYTESDTQIVFTGKATAGNEELLGTDEYVKTFKKQGNSLFDDRNFEYSRVTKDELKG